MYFKDRITVVSYRVAIYNHMITPVVSGCSESVAFHSAWSEVTTWVKVYETAGLNNNGWMGSRHRKRENAFKRLNLLRAVGQGRDFAGQPAFADEGADRDIFGQ